MAPKRGEDDPTQSADPEYAGGANLLSLKQAQQEWREKQEGKAKDG